MFSKGFLSVHSQFLQKLPRAEPLHPLGSSVRVKAFLFLLLLSLAAGTVAQTGDGQTISQAPDSQSLNTTQLAAWLIAGVPSTRLARLVGERGLANLPTNNELHQLRALGAGKDLIRVLSSGNVQSARIGRPIPPSLLKAADELSQQHFREAEARLREVVSPDDHNSALHFVLSFVYRQEENWDDAFDELGQATRLMPDLPENHSAQAYIFYR